MFIKNTFTICAFMVNCLIIIEATKIAKKIVLIEHFGICPDQKEEDMVLRIISKRYGMASGSNSVLEFTADVIYPINGTLLGNASVYKCSSLHSERDCERILFIHLPDVCHKIKETNQAWSFVFANLEPPLTCPVKTGKYEMKRGQPDFDKLKWLLDDYHVFKVIFSLYEDESMKILVCIHVVLRTSVVRVWLKD